MNAKEDRRAAKKKRNEEEYEEEDEVIDERGGGRDRGKKGDRDRDTAPVEEFDYDSFVEEGARKHLDKFVKDLATLRTGSANPGTRLN
jgi:hypothetical protein